MPNYDYECMHCGYKFEVFQSMNAKRLNKCPKCSKQVKRLIGSGAGIIFKGKGFYATDYAKKPQASDASSSKVSCPQAKPGCSGCPNLG
jgi:putative FmdB family regulatory protein